MTFLELAQALRRECGESGSGPTTVSGQAGVYERLVNWIKQADMLIQNKWRNWNFLWNTGSVSVVLGTQDYAGPSDIGWYDLDTFALDGNEIEVIPYARYRDSADRFTTMTASQPLYVVVLPNKQLRMVPTPDTSYTLTFDYFKAPTRLSANADESAIPSQFHDIIVARAMILYGNSENAPEIRQQGMEAYAENIMRLEASELPEGSIHGVSYDQELTVTPE